MIITWTDARDGREWEVRNSAPQAMAGPQTKSNDPPPEELIHFRHPPTPPFDDGGAVPNPGGRRVDDFDDAELWVLLDEALRRAAGEGA